MQSLLARDAYIPGLFDWVIRLRDIDVTNRKLGYYLGKPIGLPSIFKPLLFNKKNFLDRDRWLPRWINIKDGIFDIFSATQNDEIFFLWFVSKPISNLVLDIFRLIHTIPHKRGFNESFLLYTINTNNKAL